MEHVGRQYPAEDPLRVFPKTLSKLYSIWVSLMYPFAAVGRKLSVHYTCDWQRSQAHRIRLGNGVQIRKDATIQVAVPRESRGEPIITIDDESCLGPQCVVSGRNSIHIGRDVLVGQSVLIADHGYDLNGEPPMDTRDRRRVVIGEGSWIGYRAAIVCTGAEVVLGRNCVVAANSVVTRSFPPYSVIFGNPARTIRQFDPVKNAWVLKSA